MTQMTRRSGSIDLKINRVLKGPEIHIKYKFGDPSSKTFLSYGGDKPNLLKKMTRK